MLKLKSILDSQWFFPVLTLYYGVFYILFGESYPFNGGLSFDGTVFSSFIPDFTKSFYFDSFYVSRILPALLVSVFFKLFSINSTQEHILVAFQILNLISIIISCYFLKQILLLFKISLKIQLLSFILFLLNFGVVKFPFYLPVMTDTFALMVSTALLYFYFKNNIAGIVICTFLAAFTWPMSYYQGLLLIAFPLHFLPFKSPLKWQKISIYIGAILFALALIIIIIFIEKFDNNPGYFIMMIDRDLLPLSILGIVLLYFFFAQLFLNRTLFDVSLFLKKISYKRILISFGVFATVLLIIHFLGPKPISNASIPQILRDPTIQGLIKPLISIVSHTGYFGIIICLLFLFWRSFSKTISQMGWGILAALGLNLFLFGIAPESRHLINLVPWLIVFLAITFNKYWFPNSFYIVVGLSSFVASKIWLLLNIYDSFRSTGIDKNGSLGFPEQLFWMNIGQYMSEQMYYIQGTMMLFFTGFLFLFLYKVEVNRFDKVKLIRKYQILK
jgi:hypothetical protein